MRKNQIEAAYIKRTICLTQIGSFSSSYSCYSGTLMAVTRSEAVAVSYASTYPVALIMVVLACEFIPILFG